MQISTRANRFLPGLSNMLNQKIPKDLSADELNVVLGLGSQTVGIGATATFSQTAPRDCFIRDLVATTTQPDVVINSITINGDALVLGGTVNAKTFDFTNPNRPGFDLPCKGGTTVTVVVTGGAAAGTVGLTFAID